MPENILRQRVTGQPGEAAAAGPRSPAAAIRPPAPGPDSVLGPDFEQLAPAAAGIGDLADVVSFADLAHLTDDAWRGEPPTAVFVVCEWPDVAIARHQARRLARQHGLEPRRAGEVAIVVSELASNVVKYGVRGEVAMHVEGLGVCAAVTVVARDVGPPIRDLQTALRDGCDDRGPLDPATLVQRGGLGTGLGAVARLSDRLEVRQQPAGKEIIASFLPPLRRA